MKNTSRIFLIIGKVMAIIELVISVVICALLITFGVIALVNPELFYPVQSSPLSQEQIDSIMVMGIVFLSVGIPLLIVLPITSILSISFSNKALNALKNAKNVSGVKGHGIACIIIAAISGNEFLLAGGILLSCLRESHFQRN